jgi:hypothetical protein
MAFLSPRSFKIGLKLQSILNSQTNAVSENHRELENFFFGSTVHNTGTSIAAFELKKLVSYS